MSESGLEQKYVREAFETNWVVPLGPNVNGFEKDLEQFVGQNKRVVALSAGTAAIHLALVACGVGPGDEVCVQSFTFCASAILSLIASSSKSGSIFQVSGSESINTGVAPK